MGHPSVKIPAKPAKAGKRGDGQRCVVGELAPARSASAGGPAAARKALRAVYFSARLKVVP
jgi:hypothetical protein